MKTTLSVVWKFFSNGGQSMNYVDWCEQFTDNEDPVPCDEDTFVAMKALDLKQVLCDVSTSENHIGGDDVISFVDATIAAIKEGYEIATWYGPNTEVLIVGYRAGLVEFVDE